MSYSLRAIAAKIDPLVEHVRPLSLRTILSWQRFSENATASRLSCRELVRRHMSEQSIAIRFLSYNTYLLEALDIKMPDPFGDIRLGGKPEIDNRANEIGQKIATEKYDFVSLYEVMQEREKSAILAALSVIPKGNVYAGELTSLFTISQSLNISRHAKKNFSHEGKVYHIEPLGIDVSLDSDFYSHKGVLLTEIDTGLRTIDNQPVFIEVYSTHLMFGGGLPKAVETLANTLTPFSDHLGPSNAQERFGIQMQQVDELIEFYRQNHRPQNVAILCGDFNIDGSDTQKFAVLKSRMSAIGMVDTWLEGPLRNSGSGQTARNDDGEAPNEANFSKVCFPSSNPNAADYCDETQVVQSPSEFVGRFDYIFIEVPTVDHLCNVDFSRVRRRQFRRTPTPNQQFLSDHLGLETTFFVSLRS
jgi:endonuclease/exonuclease/phosphatase family metal-dependent hydrolase